ncbi:hypothetical protein OKA05_08650 [Luteolibacter arcticus]|uniref:Uncharacterized protein n=1 Tax=Luteolibacter arcticus TaxID=1581411 RepID=A0ABT3GG88_9BACT|nr:hypothetical protein [Luteolibacter arcticus]MCW1922621.1 hypothetical protein [Luteolibacter arcticus]
MRKALAEPKQVRPRTDEGAEAQRKATVEKFLAESSGEIAKELEEAKKILSEHKIRLGYSVEKEGDAPQLDEGARPQLVVRLYKDSLKYSLYFRLTGSDVRVFAHPPILPYRELIYHIKGDKYGKQAVGACIGEAVAYILDQT